MQYIICSFLLFSVPKEKMLSWGIELEEKDLSFSILKMFCQKITKHLCHFVLINVLFLQCVTFYRQLSIGKHFTWNLTNLVVLKCQIRFVIKINHTHFISVFSNLIWPQLQFWNKNLLIIFCVSFLKPLKLLVWLSYTKQSFK